jgi:hypothetical protein
MFYWYLIIAFRGIYCQCIIHKSCKIPEIDKSSEIRNMLSLTLDEPRKEEWCLLGC